MKTINSNKRKTASLRPDLHAIVKSIKMKDGRSIEKIVDEIFESGLRVKRLMPSSETQPLTEPTK
jgi:hypothetical protein